MNFLQNLKRLFSKKTQNPVSCGERHPVNLPEVPEEKLNAVGIAELLRSGVVIWAYYDLSKKWNTNAMMNYTGNSTETFVAYRVEDKYLVKYVAVCGEEQVFLKISEVQRMSNSNVMELFNSALKDACRVSFDNEGLTASMQYLVHDVTVEMIEEELQFHRVMYVSDEHFIKKEEAVSEKTA